MSAPFLKDLMIKRHNQQAGRHSLLLETMRLKREQIQEGKKIDATAVSTPGPDGFVRDIQQDMFLIFTMAPSAMIRCTICNLYIYGLPISQIGKFYSLLISHQKQHLLKRVLSGRKTKWNSSGGSNQK